MTTSLVRSRRSSNIRSSAACCSATSRDTVSRAIATASGWTGIFTEICMFASRFRLPLYARAADGICSLYPNHRKWNVSSAISREGSASGDYPSCP